jgi:flavin-binding protein dodecin
MSAQGSTQQTRRSAGAEVPGAVVKVIELVGSSSDSFSDAVRNAVATASRTIRHIRGVDVMSSSATVGPDGGIAVYKVTCKIAFVIEDDGAGPRLGDGEVLPGDGVE